MTTKGNPMARKRIGGEDATADTDGAGVVDRGGSPVGPGMADPKVVAIDELNALKDYAISNGLARPMEVRVCNAKATLMRSQSEPVISVWFGSEAQDMSMILYGAEARHWIIDSDVVLLKKLLRK